MTDPARFWCAAVIITVCAGHSVEVQAQARFTRAQEQQFHKEAAAALAHGRYDQVAAIASTRPDNDPSGSAFRSHLLVLRGQYREAEALIAPIAETSPSSGAGLEFGLLLDRTGRADEAANYFQAVINIGVESGDPLDFYRAGLAARARGQYREANTFFRSAALSAPGDPSVQTAWAELFLEKYNHADAAHSFREALALDDEWAPAHVGLARTLANENPPAARASADRALEIDPSHVGTHLFIAEQELGDRNMEAARKSVERALAINPSSLEARSLLAAMAFLEDQADDFEAEVARTLEINPAYGDVYRIVGSHVARAYRFDEAVTLVRRALELDSSNTRAYAELGMHLLRTGDELGAREALERAFASDPFDVITFNLLNMMDTLDEFETFERGDVIVRLHRDEAEVMSEYVLSLAQEALDTLSSRYRMKVEGPILVEVFPTHDDFAVRNLGLPGMIGALGACFGRVITMDSPRARPPGDFNWRSTLWHEVAHVITLQMSDQRVPRWLTEGISTYEEKLARPEWGRDQVLSFARALDDGVVLPLRDLNGGFSRPETISLAYFQASILVEHIVDTYGETTLQSLVRAYADGLETEDALARFGLSFEALQVSFDDAVERQFGDVRRALRPPDGVVPDVSSSDGLDMLRQLAVDHPGSYSVQVAYGMALRSAGELRAALEVLEGAVLLVPQATGIDSPRGTMAGLAKELGDRERAMRELELLLDYDATSIEAARELAALAEESGDKERMALAYDRIIGIDPFDPVSHRAIGRMAMAQGDTDRAILEFEIAIAVGPFDRVGAYCDLAESYLIAGDFDTAKREVLKALEMAPTYERAQVLLLRAVEKQP